jgi:hypothetical protein
MDRKRIFPTALSRKTSNFDVKDFIDADYTQFHDEKLFIQL